MTKIAYLPKDLRNLLMPHASTDTHTHTHANAYLIMMIYAVGIGAKTSELHKTHNYQTRPKIIRQLIIYLLK